MRFGQSAFLEKCLKLVLTFVVTGCILTKSLRTTANNNEIKFVFKPSSKEQNKNKKVVDKRRKMWYSNQADAWATENNKKMNIDN